MANLTIIITDIPDDYLYENLKTLEKKDREEFGIISQHKDVYQLNFNSIPFDCFIDLVSTASAIHTFINSRDQKKGN